MADRTLSEGFGSDIKKIKSQKTVLLICEASIVVFSNLLKINKLNLYNANFAHICCVNIRNA
jgi:hypothetical protein